MAAKKADTYIKSSEPEDASAYAANYGAHVAGTSKEDMANYYSKWATDGGYEKVSRSGYGLGLGSWLTIVI